MSLNLAELNDATRRHMLAEFDSDVAERTLFLAARLTPWGRERWPALLREALASHDDAWLATRLAEPGWLNTVESVSYDGGRSKYWRRMPEDASAQLAELEFNRFVMRGVCALAIEGGHALVVVYRARATRPRAEVAAKLGTALDARKLLADLRARVTLEEVLRTPDAFTAGLSVRLVRSA